MSHPYDDTIPAPWAPDWDALDNLRDHFARVACRLELEHMHTPALDTLTDFAAVDAACKHAGDAYRGRVSA